MMIKICLMLNLFVLFPAKISGTELGKNQYTSYKIITVVIIAFLGLAFNNMNSRSHHLDMILPRKVRTQHIPEFLYKRILKKSGNELLPPKGIIFKIRRSCC